MTERRGHGPALIYVQHLLGIGHLMRAAALARAFADDGWETHLVSGGRPVPDLRLAGANLHQLPPLTAADTGFSGLVDADGAPADETYLLRRRDDLLGLFASLAPRVLIVEHFPFGRRQMRFELMPLLDDAAKAQPRPLRLVSVRDILVERTAARHAEARDIVLAHFDHVLVHGDPDFVRFSASFPHAAEIGARLTHTGFLDGGPVAGAARRRGTDIIVSSGGGAVGRAIEDTALDAAADWTGPHRWRLMVGANRPDADVRRLANKAPPILGVERARPDFRQLLSAAAASVSQAGYNTAMDILATQVPAVLIPFASDRETEQTVRAQRLAELGLAAVVAEQELTVATLTRALRTVLAAPAPAPKFRLDGAARAVARVGELLRAAAT